MDQGEDPVKVGANLQTICYSIPELGSNLWFDAWVMPKLKESQRSEEQHDLAHEFLNFLCKTDGFTIGEGEEATIIKKLVLDDEKLNAVRDSIDAKTYKEFAKQLLSSSQEFISPLMALI